MLEIALEMQKHFKGYEYPVEIIMVSLFMKGKYSLSYREVEEIGRLKGLEADHTTIFRWINKLCPCWIKDLKRERGVVNGSWRMDETYIKVNGKWYICTGQLINMGIR